MSEGYQVIVVSHPAFVDPNSVDWGISSAAVASAPLSAPTDPFAGKGGEAMVRVGSLTVKGKSFEIKGYTFKLIISEADWNDLSPEQQGAVVKIVTEYAQSPELKQLFDYFESHDVRNIVLHFDGEKYDASGAWLGSFPTDPSNSADDLGFVRYYREKDTDDTDISPNTDIHISLNPQLIRSVTKFADTFMHELYHPYVAGINGFDDPIVSEKARRSFDDIFKNKTSGILENDELAYAATQTVIGSFNADTIAAGTGHDTLSGKEGADIIDGGDGNDFVIGGDGMDVLTSGSGRDYLSGGLDADRFVISSTNVRAIVREDGGVDTIDTGMSYAGATFERVGNSLFIQQNGRTIQVNGQWTTPGNRVEKFNFTDGSYAASVIEARADPGSGSLCYVNGKPVICFGGFGTPVVLDLDGDGLELIERRESRAAMDVDGDGVAERIGWVGGDDGLLVLDRNGDGRVNGYEEISFLGDYAGAGSDLEGLFGFDSDGDGFLSAADDRFGDFMIWRDLNGNGKSSQSELFTLEELGIEKINLEKLALSQLDPDLKANQVLATTEFFRTDGTRGLVGDMALFAGDCGCSKPRPPGLGSLLIAELTPDGFVVAQVA